MKNKLSRAISNITTICYLLLVLFSIAIAINCFISYIEVKMYENFWLETFRVLFQLVGAAIAIYCFLTGELKNLIKIINKQ